MSTEYDGKLIKDKPKGKLLKKQLPEGDILVSEGPKGDPLWKKKKQLNEKSNKDNTLNE